jgi:predicted metal-dependent RNase
MTGVATLVELKQRVSARLLDEAGVSGVGLRGNQIVVYLENDDAQVRQKAEKIARDVAPEASLTFEVAGRFRKK